METIRFNTKVPPRRWVQYNLELNPETVKLNIESFKIQITAYRYESGTLHMHIPESIPVGQNIAIIIDYEDGSGQAVFNSTQTSQPTDEPELIPARISTVLSIGIPDYTAIRALKNIPAKRYGMYSGTGFGLYLAILLNCGVTPETLVEKFKSIGMKKSALPQLLDRKQSFDPFLTFARSLVPKIDNMTLGDLEGETFIPVADATAGVLEFITKSEHGHMPVSMALCCALANLIDLKPLEVKKMESEVESIFGKKSLLWELSTFGITSPDPFIYLLTGKRRDLDFLSFVGVPEIQVATVRDLKKNVKRQQIQVDEISKFINQWIGPGLLKELIINYQPHVLPVVPSTYRLDKKQVEKLLADETPN